MRLLSGRSRTTLLARALLAAALGLAPAVARAGGVARAPDRTTATALVSSGKPAPEKDQLARDLEPLEDEALASHEAGSKWSTLQIVIVVLLIIFLLPIGLIVLIVLLIVDPPWVD
jgi:hypothetical protein